MVWIGLSGGFHAILNGDMWQIPPLDGGLLGDIPCEYIQAARPFAPLAAIAHGLLFYGVDRQPECKVSLS